jgi:hypothetical protein
MHRIPSTSISFLGLMNAANSQNLTLKLNHFSGWTYSAGHINAEMISKALFPPSPQNLVTGFTFASVFYP